MQAKVHKLSKLGKVPKVRIKSVKVRTDCVQGAPSQCASPDKVRKVRKLGIVRKMRKQRKSAPMPSQSA